MQDNRSVVLAYVDAFNRGDLDSLCDLFAPDALIWGVLGFGGMDQVRPVWKDLIDCLQIQLQTDAVIAKGAQTGNYHQEALTGFLQHWFRRVDRPGGFAAQVP